MNIYLDMKEKRVPIMDPKNTFTIGPLQTGTDP